MWKIFGSQKIETQFEIENWMMKNVSVILSFNISLVYNMKLNCVAEDNAI